MKKTKKIILWGGVVICGFVLVTFVFTFLGIDLPWTAHRASAVMIPQGVRTYEYTGYEENGIFIKEEHTEEKLREHELRLFDLSDKYNFGMYSASVYTPDPYAWEWEMRRWLVVTIEEDDFFIARGILNIYAKWNNVPIFYQFGGRIELL